MEELVDRIREGDRRSLARAMSLVDDASPGAEALRDELRQLTGDVVWWGFTGPPGVGIWANGGSRRLTGGPATWIFGVQSNLIESGAGSGPIGGGIPTTAKSIRLNDFVQFRCAPDVRAIALRAGPE